VETFKVGPILEESTTAEGQQHDSTEQKRDTNPGGGGGGEVVVSTSNDTKDERVEGGQTTELQKTISKIITIKDFVT